MTDCDVKTVTKSSKKKGKSTAIEVAMTIKAIRESRSTEEIHVICEDCGAIWNAKNSAATYGAK